MQSSSIRGQRHDDDDEDETDKDKQKETQSVPEQNVRSQSKKNPPMAAQIPRRPSTGPDPDPRRSTIASPRVRDPTWHGGKGGGVALGWRI
jgi:hypothetical protein